MAIAVHAQRRRMSADWSEVAATTIDEIPHLTPAFADQGDDDDVRRNTLCKAGEQGRFADARAGEQADSLAAHNGKHRIEGGQTGFEPRAEHTPGSGSGRCSGQRAGCGPAHQGASVERLTKRIDDATDPALVRRDPRRARKNDRVMHGQPRRGAVRHDGHAARGQPDNLAPYAACGDAATAHQHPVTEADAPVETGGDDDAAPEFGDAASVANAFHLGQDGAKPVERHICHRSTLTGLRNTVSKGITVKAD
jgi:hypothetical protein